MRVLIRLWTLSAAINVCLFTRYLMVILSGPSSETVFTMLSNAVYSVQFLFCVLQLSTQNITFGLAVSLSTYECENSTNYISKYCARLLCVNKIMCTNFLCVDRLM